MRITMLFFIFLLFDVMFAILYLSLNNFQNFSLSFIIVFNFHVLEGILLNVEYFEAKYDMIKYQLLDN